jgi:hypothetical protein
MAGRKEKHALPEFRLLVAAAVNERSSRPTTLVVLQTTKSFSTFRYTLVVDDRLENDALLLRVLGLRTPPLDLPATGPAEFRKEYEGLSGDVRIVVEGMDGSYSSISTHITPGRVTLTAPVSGRALEVDIPSANRTQSGTSHDPYPL